MLQFFLSVGIALAVDSIIGDPRWRFHPVRIMGSLAAFFERLYRNTIQKELAAGALAWFSVVVSVVAPAILLLWAARAAGSTLEVVISSTYIYFCIAPRDLAKHAAVAGREIRYGDIADARKGTSYMVSRDVSQMDKAGLTQAVIESTAENVVDGVTAPLIFAALFGPVGAVLYRVVNTLDAMFGYKNEMYLRFGRLSARADDVLGWLPARITGPLYCASAVFVGGSVVGALKAMFRDSNKHESPNAGIVESAAAGALGIQLGGAGVYSGVIVEKPLLGDPYRAIDPRDIIKLIVMMYITTALVAAVAILIAYIKTKITEGWI